MFKIVLSNRNNKGDIVYDPVIPLCLNKNIANHSRFQEAFSYFLSEALIRMEQGMEIILDTTYIDITRIQLKTIIDSWYCIQRGPKHN